MLFSISAMHLDRLMRQFGDQELVIFCDRQGGREHYGIGLRQMFEDWSLEVVSEESSRSEYVLTRGKSQARLIFMEKAECQCMAVALASILSKYLREALMDRYNLFWKRMLPDIQPTAGYHPDGVRFYQQIKSKMNELGMSDELIVRCR